MPNSPCGGKAVLFDIDGTLLDTVPLIEESYQHVFMTCLGHPIDPAVILAGIGTPLDDFFRLYWPEQADEMRKIYLKHNHARLDTHIGIFRQVPDLLEPLFHRNIPMAVVTSKSRDSAMHGLAAFDLERYFQVFIVRESTTRHKPDPEPVFEAMRQLGLSDPAKVIFVGDSLHDLNCAKQAGCHSAIVDWTVMPADGLRSAQPDLWIKNGQELADYLERL